MCGFSGTGGHAVLKTFLVLLLVPSYVWAANPYKLGELNYFEHKNPDKQSGQTFDWREASISPNGTLNYYTPPHPVLALLDNPTPENARAYLAWQKQKLQRIKLAQTVIAQVGKEEQHP